MNPFEVRSQYLDLGYDCIPIQSRSKIPLAKAWQSRPPVYQWHSAPPDSNFGLRAGGGRAFIDADDKTIPGTLENVTNWLAGLGYSRGTYPIVRTASGMGGHVYLNFEATLTRSSRKLNPKMGAGEFRYGAGAYVVAPPSVVPGGRYELVEGDLLHLPTLDAHDVGALITDTAQPDRPRRMSMLARALVMGQGAERYKSRSEGEAALMLSLINSGYGYPEAKALFDENPCFGCYAEKRADNPNAAERWLRMTYQEALAYSQNESPARRTIQELRERAEVAAWKRVSDRNVYLAHLAIAFQAAKTTYAAAVRDLAVEAGIQRQTATSSTRRLILDGLLHLVRSYDPSNPMRPTVYSLEIAKIEPLPKNTVREWYENGYLPALVAERGKVVDLPGLETSDAFRNGRGRLGRRAGQIYKLLLVEPMTTAEIVARTGASLHTVQRALAKLRKLADAKTGELFEMVTREGDKWRAWPADLEQLEASLHTYGMKTKQRNEYEKERRARRHDLERGKMQEEGQS